MPSIPEVSRLQLRQNRTLHTDWPLYCEPLLSGSQPTLSESDSSGSLQVRDYADAINRFACEYHCSALRLKATPLLGSEGRTFFSRAGRLAGRSSLRGHLE